MRRAELSHLHFTQGTGKHGRGHSHQSDFTRDMGTTMKSLRKGGKEGKGKRKGTAKFQKFKSYFILIFKNQNSNL